MHMHMHMHMPELAGATGGVQPDLMLSPDEPVEPSLPRGNEGVQRRVWHSRLGKALIEVAGQQVFVDGHVLQPHVA